MKGDKTRKKMELHFISTNANPADMTSRGTHELKDKEIVVT